MAFTKEFLGEEAQDRMMAMINEVGATNFDTSVYTLSNGVHCDSQQQKCYVQKHSETVDSAHTAVLYGESD